MRRSITLTWHGHSCFSIDNGSWSLALDPYDPQMVGYPPLSVQANALLASHQHGDHNYRAVVRLIPAPGDLVRTVAPDGNLPATADPALFYVKSVETLHDDAGGSKRGKNLVHVIDTQGFSIVHLGDLGHVLTDVQTRQIGRPDLLLVPTGGLFTIDAAAACQVVRQLQPRNIAPMHYHIGFGSMPIAGVEPFLKLMAADWAITRLDKPVLQLDSEQAGSCFVFRYQAGV